MNNSGLFADLHALTTLRTCFELGFEENAVFSLFVRRLPPERNYLVACGLDVLLNALQNLRFEGDDIAALAALGFPQSFLDRLATFRFEGDVHAMPEGTPFFANEPILEVVAPIGQAQLVEALVLNQVGFQTLVASKAARIVGAAEGRPIQDFGASYAHGIDAALNGARAAHIGGMESTSNLLAASTHGIPAANAMSDSLVLAFPNETEAFPSFLRRYPEAALVVDTYDTMRGVRKIIALSRELRGAGGITAIRIDSGDLLDLSRRARNLLDGAALSDIRVVASGGLDEHVIEALLSQGAPIDSFAVDLVSADAPMLELAYQLAGIAGEGRVKLSVGKRNLPGRKQVFRTFAGGEAYEDTVGGAEESLAGEPLLVEVMRGGRRIGEPESLATIRARCMAEVARLPTGLKVLAPAERPYSVEISPVLLELERQTREKSAHSSL
jgi:nicotinate phosphoribosyltransferase